MLAGISISTSVKGYSLGFERAALFTSLPVGPLTGRVAHPGSIDAAVIVTTTPRKNALRGRT